MSYGHPVFVGKYIDHFASRLSPEAAIFSD